MTETIEVGPQYYGFPGVGFGGYVAGRLAAVVGGPTRVTLRRPPPLQRPMTVERDENGGARLLAGEVLVAEAVAGPPDVAAPQPVGFEEATAASERFAGWRAHPFPMCFTCGIERREEDGLRIFPGPLDGREGAAGAWVPHPAFADEDGAVRPEFVWAAMDCPSYWGMFPDGSGPAAIEGAGEGVLKLTTGRLHSQILRPVVARHPHVVLGWPIATAGRKFLGGAAVFTEAGELCAVSKATWLPLPARDA